MPRYGRVPVDAIVEVIETDNDIAAMFHPDIAAQFEAVPETAEPGMVRDGSGWAWPPQSPAPPKYATAEAAMAAMVAFAERAEAQIAGPVSRGERDSWTAKEAEARAWVADNQAATPILSAEAAVTGETMADLTAKVITRADALKPITGEIAGLRRATELALAAAAEPDDYETILQTAQAQAIALAAARGITLEA